MSPDETVTMMTQLVLPPDTNNHGTVFGGRIAAWIDICAAVSAMRFAGQPVVTASIDELHFVAPVHRGMAVELRSMVNMAWRSSMEVGVRIEAQDMRTGERVHCCSAYVTFVGLDDEGRPRKLPSLELGTPEQHERAKRAQERRDHRLSVRAAKRANR